jgi:hypothetical protein
MAPARIPSGRGIILTGLSIVENRKTLPKSSPVFTTVAIPDILFERCM